MNGWNTVDLLDVVEEYANSQTWIESEGQLSERFDEEHKDWLHDHRDDQAAIDQAFNNWADMLCKDGVIHPEQYDKYTYVGKYAY